jgi:uncharacterized cupredoxin-like copper-binding protein
MKRICSSIILALVLSVGIGRVEGQIETAKHVAEDTVDTAGNVAHSVVKGTKKAVNTVVDALTPDPDARRVDVTLSDYKIDMPTTLKPGKTAFVVMNAGKHTHSFGVRGNGTDLKFATSVSTSKTKVLHVTLKRGTYTAYCPTDGHANKDMRVTLTVR